MRTLMTLLILALSGPAAAATVSEAELLETVSRHPAYAALLAERDAAEADLLGARLLDEPVLDAEAERPGTDEHQTTVTATWQLPRRERGPRIAAARARSEAATATAAARRLELELELLDLYADWWAAEARTAVLDAQAGRLDELARRARERAEAGEAPGLAASRLALSAEAARAESAVAAAVAEELERRVAGWIAAEPPLEPLPPALPPPGDLGAPSRADVEALRRRRAAAAADVDAAARVVETPALTLGWQRATTGDTTADGPVVALAWTVPLLDRNRADRARAAALARRAAAELAAAERRAAADLEGAAAAYEALSERLAATSDGADPDRVAAAAAQAFVLGEASVTDLLETLDTALSAHLARVDLHRAAVAARNRLAAALGRLPGEGP